jgi:hypothetical protein
VLRRVLVTRTMLTHSRRVVPMGSAGDQGDAAAAIAHRSAGCNLARTESNMMARCGCQFLELRGPKRNHVRSLSDADWSGRD